MRIVLSIGICELAWQEEFLAQGGVTGQSLAETIGLE